MTAVVARDPGSGAVALGVVLVLSGRTVCAQDRPARRPPSAGAYEVPPTASQGSGYFEAVYRPSTKVLEYRLNLRELSGPITMGHLQGPAAAVGENGRRSCPSTSRSTTTRSGTAPRSPRSRRRRCWPGSGTSTSVTLQVSRRRIRGQILPLKKVESVSTETCSRSSVCVNRASTVLALRRSVCDVQLEGPVAMSKFDVPRVSPREAGEREARLQSKCGSPGNSPAASLMPSPVA